MLPCHFLLFEGSPLGQDGTSLLTVVCSSACFLNQWTGMVLFVTGSVSWCRYDGQHCLLQPSALGANCACTGHGKSPLFSAPTSTRGKQSIEDMVVFCSGQDISWSSAWMHWRNSVGVTWGGPMSQQRSKLNALDTQWLDSHQEGLSHKWTKCCGCSRCHRSPEAEGGDGTTPVPCSSLPAWCDFVLQQIMERPHPLFSQLWLGVTKFWPRAGMWWQYPSYYLFQSALLFTYENKPSAHPGLIGARESQKVPHPPAHPWNLLRAPIRYIGFFGDFYCATILFSHSP